MPIETDEELFAAICALFHIGQIHEILNVSDADIRSVCTVHELAELVIDLKKEVMKEMTDRLVHRSTRAISGSNSPDSTELRYRIERSNY